MYRDNVVVNIFDDRKKAISHLKLLLMQTYKDLKKQDQTNKFDYCIVIPKIEIIPLKEREAFLGL